MKQTLLFSGALRVLVALAVFASATGVPRFGRGVATAPTLYRVDRDKTGTSQGEIGGRMSQTTPPAVVTAGGGNSTERGRFESNPPRFLAKKRIFSENCWHICWRKKHGSMMVADVPKAGNSNRAVQDSVSGHT